MKNLLPLFRLVSLDENALAYKALNKVFLIESLPIKTVGFYDNAFIVYRFTGSEVTYLRPFNWCYFNFSSF